MFSFGTTLLVSWVKTPKKPKTCRGEEERREEVGELEAFKEEELETFLNLHQKELALL